MKSRQISFYLLILYREYALRAHHCMLHQKNITCNANELKISLKVLITHDMLTEQLSYGDNRKVIEPASLAVEIKEAHEKAYRKYLK